MKIGKTLLGVVVAIVVVVVIAVTLVLQNLDGIVKQVIETAGSKATQTSVTLDGVSIKLMDGRGELLGLVVANPSGFKADNAFALDDIVLDIDPASLTGPVYVINEVKIEGAKLTYEQVGKGNNFDQLLANVKKGSSAETQPTEQQPSGDPAKDIRLAIDKITLANNSVTLITEQFGEHTMDMPTINLAQIGDHQNGLAPDQIAGEVMSQLLQQVQKRASDLVSQIASKEMQKIKDEAVEEAKKKGDDALKKAKDSLRDRLGGG